MKSPDIDAIVQLLVVSVESPAADARTTHAFDPILDVTMRVIAVIGYRLAGLVDRYQHDLGLGKALHGRMDCEGDFVFLEGNAKGIDVEGGMVHEA